MQLLSSLSDVELSLPAVLGAAIIAGLSGTLGVMLGRDQRSAEFRQSWVDQLRGECANLVVQVQLLRGGHFYNANDQSASRSKAIIDFRIAEAAIRLRLDKRRKLSHPVIEQIDGISELVSSGNYDISKYNDLIEEFIEKSQDLISDEWRKIRGGSKIVRMIFKIIIIISIIVVLFFASRE
jgi:hypothetical protein